MPGKGTSEGRYRRSLSLLGRLSRIKGFTEAFSLPIVEFFKLYHVAIRAIGEGVDKAAKFIDRDAQVFKVLPCYVISVASRLDINESDESGDAHKVAKLEMCSKHLLFKFGVFVASDAVFNNKNFAFYFHNIPSVANGPRLLPERRPQPCLLNFSENQNARRSFEPFTFGRQIVPLPSIARRASNADIAFRVRPPARERRDVIKNNLIAHQNPPAQVAGRTVALDDEIKAHLFDSHSVFLSAEICRRAGVSSVSGHRCSYLNFPSKIALIFAVWSAYFALISANLSAVSGWYLLRAFSTRAGIKSPDSRLILLSSLFVLSIGGLYRRPYKNTRENLYPLQEFCCIFSLLLYNACRGYDYMNGKEESAFTETVCRSDREALYNCNVLASGRTDSAGSQAPNADRPLLGNSRGYEAPRIKAGAEAGSEKEKKERLKPRPSPKRKLSTDKVLVLARRYESGEKVKDLASSVNVSTDVIYREFQKHNIQTRSTSEAHRRLEIADDEILKRIQASVRKDARSNVYIFKVTGTKMIDVLYGDCSVALPRKLVLAGSILSTSDQRRN